MSDSTGPVGIQPTPSTLPQRGRGSSLLPPPLPEGGAVEPGGEGVAELCRAAGNRFEGVEAELARRLAQTRAQRDKTGEVSRWLQIIH